MNEIYILSQILEEGEQLLDRYQAGRRTRAHIQHQYLAWWDKVIPAIPTDLQPFFVEITNGMPRLALDDHEAWAYLTIDLEKQCQLLRVARQRLNPPHSSFPAVRQAIAQVCRKAYKTDSIKDLFITCGCEPGWYIPAFDPEPKAKTEHLARGWLDGILLFAKDREASILRRLCERILSKPRLPKPHYELLQSVLAAFDPPAPNPLDTYQLHPRVTELARPYMAMPNPRYDDAIFAVCRGLEETIQLRTSSNEHGQQLMQHSFAPGADKKQTRIRITEPTVEQNGWMYLYMGATSVLRNPRAHRTLHTTTEQEAIEWLHFLSALFRTLDGGVPISPSNEII